MPAIWAQWDIPSQVNNKLLDLLPFGPLWVMESAYAILEIAALIHSCVTLKANRLE